MEENLPPLTLSLTKTDIACLERCQNWFIRKVFNLPKFSSHLLLLKISGLISVENEIAKRKLLFFARMALSTSDTVLCKLFQARVRSFLTIRNNSFGFIAAHENNAWTEYASVHQDMEILNKHSHA